MWIPVSYRIDPYIDQKSFQKLEITNFLSTWAVNLEQYFLRYTINIFRIG